MKRWMKWIGIAFLVPLALILLLSVLLYFPPVQDFARNKIVAYASTSTGIDIRIAKVRLSFPLNLTIQDVLALRTPADTRSVHDMVRAVVHNQQMVLVHTTPGAATVVARLLDRHADPEILGAVAGNDVVLIAPRHISRTRQAHAAVVRTLEQAR